MKNNKTLLLLVSIIFISLTTYIFNFISNNSGKNTTFLNSSKNSQSSQTTSSEIESNRAPKPKNTTLSPSPSPQFQTYNLPDILEQGTYEIYLVGDSMTKALGPFPYQLSKIMNNFYPEKNFVIENYSRGQTSIQKLPELLRSTALSNGDDADPLIDRNISILIIESMAYNPIIADTREIALQQQEEVLDQVMLTLTKQHPEAAILFLATIAPSEQYYAQGVQNISASESKQRAQQRKSFIENFISYANEHSIPLIDVYHKSLQSDGSANLSYIRNDDYIHPSQKGVEFIQKEIADFLIEQNYLPK